MIAVLLVLAVVVVARRRRRAARLAGLDSTRPTFTVAPPVRTMSVRKTERL